MKKAIILILVAIFVGALFFLFLQNRPKPIQNIPSANSSPTLGSDVNLENVPALSTFSGGLTVPWSMVFLPDNTMLVSERPGTLRIIDSEGKVSSPVGEIEVRNIGEGGLLGIELDPEFENNKYLYAYYTYSSSGNNTLNRVSRFTFENNSLSDEKIIVDSIPGASNHNGGRIKFGPDGFLYITTGDAQDPSRAQDRNSLAGKILRVNKEGQQAQGNPFNTKVYSYGHRNPQGIAWNQKDELWSTEHGRSGALSGLDEVNLIEPGNNYGWDIIQGDNRQSGMITPVLNSGEDTWAPGGAVFAGEKLYFVGLRGQALYEVDFSGSTPSLKEYLKGQFGRLRDITLGPDGMLYVSTSNRDGRGSPSSNDDRILRINPQKIEEL